MNDGSTETPGHDMVALMGGNANQQLIDPMVLSALQAADPLQALLDAHQRRQKPDALQQILALLQPSSALPHPAPTPLPIMDPYARTLTSPEQFSSRMGEVRPAAVQPGDIAGMVAGSAIGPTGRAVLGSERGAIGEKVTDLAGRRAVQEGVKTEAKLTPGELYAKSLRLGGRHDDAEIAHEVLKRKGWARTAQSGPAFDDPADYIAPGEHRIAIDPTKGIFVHEHGGFEVHDGPLSDLPRYVSHLPQDIRSK